MPDSILARFRAREIALFTPELSKGARLVYLALDDYSRDAGECFPSQAALSGRLGIPLRSFQRYLAELVKEGIVVAARSRFGGFNRYRLSYAKIGATDSASPAKSGASVPPNVAADIRKKQDIETERHTSADARKDTKPPAALPVCPDCNGRMLVIRVIRGYGTAAPCPKCLPVRRSA